MYKTVSPGAIGHGKSFKDAAEACAKAGFKGYWFEMWSDAALPAGETRALLAKTGLRAAGFGLPVDFRGEKAEFEADLAKLETHARYAESIGATRCATWILPYSNTLPYAENFILHRDRLRACCEVLKAHGITLGLEFISPPKLRKGVKHEFAHNLDQMLELCAAIGTGNAGLLLDVWHWDMAGLPRADFSKFTGKQVALVHINDAPEGIPVSEQEDLARRLPGETGVLRIAEFFDGLKSIGYDGPVLAEPFTPRLKEMPFEKALETVMESINKVWPK
jgi:sugar phosphate isomerase/epimerase